MNDVTTDEINKRGAEIAELLNKSGLPLDSATMYGLIATSISIVSNYSPTRAEYQSGIMELARMLGDWSGDILAQRFGESPDVPNPARFADRN